MLSPGATAGLEVYLYNYHRYQHHGFTLRVSMRMVFIRGSSMASEQFAIDVNETKLWSTSKAISAQSDLVDYERGLRTRACKSVRGL